jgi:hypothetical protein
MNGCNRHYMTLTGLEHFYESGNFRTETEPTSQIDADTAVDIAACGEHGGPHRPRRKVLSELELPCNSPCGLDHAYGIDCHLVPVWPCQAARARNGNAPGRTPERVASAATPVRALSVTRDCRGRRFPHPAKACRGRATPSLHSARRSSLGAARYAPARSPKSNRVAHKRA